MTVRIDRESKVPPYEQVRSQLAAQINAGTLVVGSRLPTVRQMAADLGIAANTIARAYRELEAAGLIETHGRGGCLVASTGDASKEQARQAAMTYATTVRNLGISTADALAIVSAALER
jgi:DNA-binding transcriptional regulator YhcF (GntR family)